MYSTDDMSLKWKEFEENLVASFTQLRRDNDFTDVTLVCEDGLQIEAHRLVLCASSSFFKTILKMNSHSYPLVYMRGIMSSELTPLVEFLYNGEATVQPEDLDTFLLLAEELQLKGLTDLRSNQTRESKTELGKRVLSNPPNPSSQPLFVQQKENLLGQRKENFGKPKENGPKKPVPAISDVELLSKSMEDKIRSMMTVSIFWFVYLVQANKTQFFRHSFLG